MIGEPNPYPAMKDSGVEWLGDVPAHWEEKRIKTVLRERSEKGYPDEPLLAATQTKGVVRKEQYENRTVVALNDLNLLKLVRVGDFVISLRSFQGGIEYAREQGIISPAYTILYPFDPKNHDYLTWLFKSRPFIENLSLFVTGIREGQNIDYEKLSRSRIPLPPLSEQSAIVRFLEHADFRIRRAVGARRRLIALLNEEKQAVIHRAVTRGLEPDVPLKPSGVEWLGDVPAHWDIRRLKWALRLQRGYDLPQEKRLPGPYPVVSSGGIIDTHHEYRTEGPGVVMGRYGSTEAVFFITENFWPHNTSLFVTDFQGNLPQWGYYLLRAISKGDYSGKSAVPGINRKDLFEISVPVPPIKDQMRIVPFLIAAEDQNHLRIVAAQKEIDLLLEFRTRLIADVVTGKFDVRAAAAALPDEADEPAILDDVDAPADAEADVPLEIGVEDADGIEA